MRGLPRARVAWSTRDAGDSLRPGLLGDDRRRACAAQAGELVRIEDDVQRGDGIPAVELAAQKRTPRLPSTDLAELDPQGRQTADAPDAGHRAGQPALRHPQECAADARGPRDWTGQSRGPPARVRLEAHVLGQELRQPPGVLSQEGRQEVLEHAARRRVQLVE